MADEDVEETTPPTPEDVEWAETHAEEIEENS